MNPKLTVGLLAYNHERYIECCIKSILEQDYSDFEIIILNDASADKTDYKIREYLEKLKSISKRVKYICHAVNCGNIPQNFNEIVREARGEYFWALSCDDMFGPSAFRKMVKILDENLDCGVAYSNMNIIDDNYQYKDPI